jgi:hypothetical protein
MDKYSLLLTAILLTNFSLDGMNVKIKQYYDLSWILSPVDYFLDFDTRIK